MRGAAAQPPQYVRITCATTPIPWGHATRYSTQPRYTMTSTRDHLGWDGDPAGWSTYADEICVLARRMGGNLAVGHAPSPPMSGSRGRASGDVLPELTTVEAADITPEEIVARLRDTIGHFAAGAQGSNGPGVMKKGTVSTARFPNSTMLTPFPDKIIVRTPSPISNFLKHRFG